MPPKTPDETQELTLQYVVFPEQGVSTEASLHYQPTGEVSFDSATDTLTLAPGARVSFGTYFNAFSAGSWRDGCGLESLSFRISGAGQIKLEAFRSIATSTRKPVDIGTKLVAEDSADLDAGEHGFDLTGPLAHDGPAVLHIEIEATGPAPVRIDASRFTTRDPIRTLPRLTLSITTFKREAEVEATARRLDAFLQSYEFADQVNVQVVDNGQSAQIEESAHIRYFENANLGGAGGFARGMLEARAGGASHCLFMDDDASFHMENIRRTFAFLALTTDPKTAIAGAMITNMRKYEMWEAGALFNGICRPRHIHADLREREAVFRMLLHDTERLPSDAYGGWWYFAFPLAEAKHYPFPFFVRGDDSGFSLANQFHIRTLNGVVSFQDAFGEKETPLINYLDARYHLIHHLVFEDLERSAWRTTLVPLRLIVRSIVRFHYEAAEAQLLAMRDVMAGPDFFLANADMAERRAKLGALYDTEKWRPVTLRPTPLRTPSRITDRLWALTLNGHLLPFFKWFAARRVLRRSLRGPNWPVWGAQEISYVNRETNMGYTVRLDRKRGLRLLREAIAQARALARTYPTLRDEYRARYGEITDESTWRRLLGLAPKDS